MWRVVGHVANDDVINIHTSGQWHVIALHMYAVCLLFSKSISRHTASFSFTTGGVQSIIMSISVYLCPLAYLRNNTTKLH